MRIISGIHKGRRLRTVKDLSVRPATDRVKQTIFDMLSTRIEWEGARVLDLFAGSGALGIEALSRGAAHAVFVESEADVAEYIEANVQMIGCENQAEVIETDALAFIARCKETFDLIFADPPYGFAATPQIAGLIFAANILTPGGYLLIEHTTEMKFETTRLYRIAAEKRFGRTVVTFFRHQPAL